VLNCGECELEANAVTALLRINEEALHLYYLVAQRPKPNAANGIHQQDALHQVSIVGEAGLADVKLKVPWVHLPKIPFKS